MAIQLILFEIAIGLTVLGALLAHKRSLGERVLVSASLILSYVIAFLLAKLGVFDSTADVVLGVLSSVGALQSVLSSSVFIESTVGAVIKALIRPIAMTAVFILLCIVFRIVVAIVIRAAHLKEKCSFFSADDAKVWKKIVVCALGAVTTFALVMLSYLPIYSIEALAKPAVERAKAEQYEGTYVAGIAEIADKNFLPTGEGSLYGGLQKYTGFAFILDKTAESLARVSVTDSEGNKTDFEVDKAFSAIAESAVDGMAIYEYTCRPDDNTMKEMAGVADIIERLADCPVLLRAGLEFVGEGDGESGEGISGMLVDMLRENYVKSDISNLQDDLSALASIIETACTDLGSAPLRTSRLIPELFTYLSNTENSVKISEKLSTMTAFDDTLNIIIEYGTGVLAKTLNISEDKASYYAAYLDTLYSVANERTHGDFYESDVEKFIRYAAENGIVVSDYKIANPTELTEIDFAYTNYVHFFSHMENLEAVFAGYLLDGKSLNTVYTAMDGTLFVYSASDKKWSVATDEEGLKASSFASQYLACALKDIFSENIEYTVTKEDLKKIASDAIEILRSPGCDFIISDARREKTVAILSSFVSIDSFDPEDAIYRSDIMASIKSSAISGEEDARHFATIISAATEFASKIYGKSSSGIALYIDNFHLVGRLLDSMQKMEKTKDIPSKMLLAITQHKDFGKYFVGDSIKELTENVKKGTSTYEELFTSVQAFYNIVNQIIPA